MKINPNTKRHGKAAAVALWSTLESINHGNYGEPKAVHDTHCTLHAYLRGYANADIAAKVGFLDILGEIMGCNIDCGSIDAELLSKPKEMRGLALTSAERKAHARAWVKGGAHG